MKTTIAAALLLAATTAAAQNTTLRDMQPLLREHSQKLSEATARARQDAAVLNTVNQAVACLDTMQPAVGLDKAVKVIDEFVARNEHTSMGITLEMQRWLNKARQPLTDAKQSPGSADMEKLREKIHHEVVHPLQVRVGENVWQLDNLIKSYRAMENDLMNAMSLTAGALAGSGRNP